MPKAVIRDAARLSPPVIPFPDFQPLAVPSPLDLWCNGIDCELPPGAIPKRRFSRNTFFLTSPHRRPIWTKVSNRILVLERWAGYLVRLARMDFEASTKPVPVADPTPEAAVRRGRGRPRKGQVSV